MKDFSLNSLGFRVGLAFALLIIVMQLLVLFVQSRKTYQSEIDAEIHAARNLILMAESVRQNMERKWELGLFSPETLRGIKAETPQQYKEKILAAVPVVAAWESAKAKAVEGGFQFRTPRGNARNPDNNPDLLEQQALEYFSAHPDAREYHLVDESMNAIRYFRPVRLSETCLNCHGDPARSQEIWGTSDGKDITGFPMDGKRVGDLHGAFEIIRPLDEADAAVQDAILEGVLSAVLAILIGTLVIGILISRMLSRPVHLAIDKLARAESENDLTVRLETQGSDELSSLALAFNGFFERIQHSLKVVNDVSAQIRQASGQLGTVTEKTAEGAAIQRTETEQAATAMNEMTATVQEVARNTVTAAEQAETANQAAASGRTEVDNTIRMIQSLAREVSGGTELIERLNDHSERIGSVIDVIRDIAEQTNLLALNAAIEAARAGDQGRGFAVVAGEVRTLAGRTHDSTREIQEMIEKLQQGTRDVVHSMESGRDQANESVSQATRAGQALQAITEAVGAISQMNTQIATSAEEQTVVATEVDQNVTNIAGIAEEAVSLSQEVAAAGQLLEQLSVQLRGTVEQFKV